MFRFARDTWNWGSNRGLTSNKPTYYFQDDDDWTFGNTEIKYGMGRY